MSQDAIDEAVDQATEVLEDVVESACNWILTKWNSIKENKNKKSQQEDKQRSS